MPGDAVANFGAGQPDQPSCFLFVSPTQPQLVQGTHTAQGRKFPDAAVEALTYYVSPNLPLH